MNSFFAHRIFFLAFFFSVIVSQSGSAQCKVSQIVEGAKLKIDADYLYDGFSLSNFQMNDKVKHMQVEFTALKGQQYKLYFCNSGFEEEVKVSVFKTEKNGESGPDLLGTVTKKDAYLIFEVMKTGTYTVDYTIPVCENAEYGMVKDECMVMLISYKRK